MASRALQRPERKRETKPSQELPWLWNVSLGSCFALASVVLFLSLLTHTPHDIPAWSSLALSDQPNPMAENMMGRMGSVLAAYSFWMFGAAAYLLPILLVIFAAVKLGSGKRIRFSALAGAAGMMISAASILFLQQIWAWEDVNVTPYGVGGGLGYVVGNQLFYETLGSAGSIALFGCLYFISLVLVVGLKPSYVFREIWNEIKITLLKRSSRKDPNPQARFDSSELAFQPSSPAPRSLSSRKATVEAPKVQPKKNPEQKRELPRIEIEEDYPQTESSSVFDEEPLTSPKIIDAAAPKPIQTKPALSEVWQKRREQKEERVAFAKPRSLTLRYKNYKIPPLDILNWPDSSLNPPADEGALLEMQNTIIHTLGTFDIKVTAGDITKGPAITRYEVYPSAGLRVSRIVNLEPDLARATRAERINILAPIPGRDTVGIELPNKDKIVVPIRELMEDEAFQNGKAKIPLALGKDVYGKAIIADLASMPHLLVAGATGSGKSVCINSIITSLLCRFAPDELRFIMIDPKVVEMQGYKDLPHLALPVVTDPKQSLMALKWVVNEMEKRYQIFAKEGCRNFDSFNSRNTNPKAVARSRSRAGSTQSFEALEPEAAPISSHRAAARPRKRSDHPDAYNPHDVLDELDDEDGYVPSGSIWEGNSEPPARKEPELEIPDSLPYIVVIVDELADLMQTAPADIEVAIARIAQKARAAGIHLILATQTPRADVVTGIIKANIPCRIAFQVSSALDSRVIMDRKGAEKLVGKGDMLYLPPGTSQLVRAQGTMVTDDEINDLVDFACDQAAPSFETVLPEPGEEGADEEGGNVSAEDEAVLEKVIDVIRTEKKASTSLIQRRLRLGYTRAARMMDILEDRGIIGPGEGAKPREILVEL